MCGRFCITCEPVALEEAFSLEWPGLFMPLAEIFPSQQIPVLLLHPDNSCPAIQFLKWGLVPHWVKDTSKNWNLFNARIESAHEKPSFRDAYRSRRCLIPASGYWEWQNTPQGKVKHFFEPTGSTHYVFAGLWDICTFNGNQPPLTSTTILTTAASPDILPIHDRMPVILPPEKWENWLRGKSLE